MSTIDKLRVEEVQKLEHLGDGSPAATRWMIRRPREDTAVSTGIRCDVAQFGDHFMQQRKPRAFFASHPLLMTLAIIAIVILEVALIWALGNNGDYFDPSCMQPNAACSRLDRGE